MKILTSSTREFGCDLSMRSPTLENMFFFLQKKTCQNDKKHRLQGGVQQKWLHAWVFLYAPQTWNMKIHWPNFNVQGPHNCFYFQGDLSHIVWLFFISWCLQV